MKFKTGDIIRYTCNTEIKAREYWYRDEITISEGDEGTVIGYLYDDLYIAINEGLVITKDGLFEKTGYFYAPYMIVTGPAIINGVEEI